MRAAAAVRCRPSVCRGCRGVWGVHNVPTGAVPTSIDDWGHRVVSTLSISPPLSFSLLCTRHPNYRSACACLHAPLPICLPPPLPAPATACQQQQRHREIAFAAPCGNCMVVGIDVILSSLQPTGIDWNHASRNKRAALARRLSGMLASSATAPVAAATSTKTQQATTRPVANRRQRVRPGRTSQFPTHRLPRGRA